MRIIAGTLRSKDAGGSGGAGDTADERPAAGDAVQCACATDRGCAFLDLYAGSGAVGIEALSRGAAQVVFVERAAPALKVLRANLEQLGLKGGFRDSGGERWGVSAAGAAGERGDAFRCGVSRSAV